MDPGVDPFDPFQPFDGPGAVTPGGDEESFRVAVHDLSGALVADLSLAGSAQPGDCKEMIRKLALRHEPDDCMQLILESGEPWVGQLSLKSLLK
ncbi:unnamed protein product, partial [Symbiodinium pilosum]